MIQNFRGKNIKDIEAPSETIISNMNFTSSSRNIANIKSSSSITEQQLIDDNFDNFIEKRK